MGSKTTTTIVAVKQEIRLEEWAAQIEAQQASGMTVQQWCAENGIKEKTYYELLLLIIQLRHYTSREWKDYSLQQRD